MMFSLGIICTFHREFAIWEREDDRFLNVVEVIRHKGSKLAKQNRTNYLPSRGRPLFEILIILCQSLWQKVRKTRMVVPCKC